MPGDRNPRRALIFVDFWNYELTMKELEQGFRTDWRRLPQEIVQETAKLVASPAGMEFMGMRVYGSYAPKTDGELHRWATTVLARFPGVYVEFVPRQKKKTGPRCPTCRFEVAICPACGNTMLGMGEKGVDTRIAADMVRYAWEDAYDVGVLVSADKDFEPVVNFLGTKGITIIHGAFPPKGAVVSAACWGQIDLAALRQRFRR